MPFPLLTPVAFLAIFVTGLLGGLLPLSLSRAQAAKRLLTLGSTFAAGVFLGAGLLHLLPDASKSLASGAGASSYPLAALLCVCGFSLLLFIEKVALGSEEEAALSRFRPRGPVVLAYALMLALSVHSLIAGTALGAEEGRAEFLVLLLAILAHKGAAAFALGVTLHRAGFAGLHYYSILVVFCFSTPLGLVLGAVLEEGLRANHALVLSGVFDALAAGTFIYVATIDILAQELGSGGEIVFQFVLFSVGLVVMALLAIWA